MTTGRTLRDARPSPDGPHLRLAMLSQPRYLAAARAASAAFARQAGFDEHASGHIALAVDEALCNVVKHGYDRREDGPIWVDLTPITESGVLVGIRIVIEDEARQAPIETIRSRSLEEIRPGGLGVHIIKEVMDTADYEHRPEGGMRLTLTRRLPGAGSKVKYGVAQNGATTGGERGEEST